MTAFRVELDCYQGPLDLLVFLVRQDEVDVLEIAVREITRRYLETFELQAGGDLDEAGDFIVLASTLLEFKSRRLVPSVLPMEEAEQEEPTRQELVRQLLEYKRFREAAALLQERARAQHQKLARQAEADVGQTDPADRPIRELELWDLVSAFSRLMKETIVPTADNIFIDQTPIAVYMERLEAMVLTAGGLLFADLLGRNNSKSQLIGKFLALLELIKNRRVWVEIEGPGAEPRILPPREAPPELEPDESMPMADANVPPEVEPTVESAATPRSAWDDFEPLLEDGEPSDPEDPTGGWDAEPLQ